MDNLNARAELKVVVEGLNEAVAGFERLYEATEDKRFDKYGRTVARVSGQIREHIGEAEKATKSTRRMTDAELKFAEGIYNQVQAYQDVTAAQKAHVASQTAAQKAAAAEQKRIYDDYLSSQRAGLAVEKENAAVRAQAVAGIDRASAAFDKRVAAEARLDRQRRMGNQTHRQQMSAWDAEFKALDKATAATGDMAGNLPRLRYALYDIASTAMIVSGAITGVGVAVAALSAQFESAFTDVERTLEPGTKSVEELREELIGLTREIPVAFTEVSRIATLGNQLGIAGDDVASFTETVARFSAVTGVSVDEAAKAFGAMQFSLGVRASEFENLGAAIALVGRSSVATEPEILSLTREIGVQAHQAGFSAHQVVALAGTLGQLRVPPERARGSLTTYFQTLNQAVAEGGEDLQHFATVTGLAADQLSAMVRQGQGVEVFQRFIQGLGRGSDVVEVTQALDALGLSQLRVSDVFQRLSQSSSEFNRFLGIGAKGYREGAELARQYGLVVDDLASKWQIFLNALSEAGAAVGATLAPTLGAVLEILSRVFAGISDLAQTPAGAWAVGLTAALAGIVAALSAVVGGAALAGAAVLAMRTAAAELGVTSLLSAGGVRALVASFLGLEAGATRAAVGLRIFRLALISTGIGAAIAALGFLIGLFVDFEGTILSVEQPIHFVIDAIVGLGKAIAYTGRNLVQFLQSIPLIGEAFKGIPLISDKGIENFFNSAGALAHHNFNKWANEARKARDATADFEEANYDFADSFGDIADAADTAAQEVRTLVDYANDLGGVFKRAFDIRFGPQQGLDSITSGWSTIAKNIAAARDEMAQYRIELGQLAADRAIKQYWLMVAENYGDTLRAQKLRAELAELDGKQADIQKKLNAAQAKTNKTLTGNSDAAVENRAEILGLVTNYQNYLQALAASGASQEDLQRESARLRAEFVQQATRMGYNRTEVEKYAVAFDDMRIAIQNVPRNITVSADTRPAFQALNEFLAQAAAKKATIDIGGLFKNTGYQDGQVYAADWRSGFRAYINKGGGIQFIDQRGGRVASVQAFADGGYTGRGGKYDVAGLVHKGEYVVPKKYVDQRTGLPYASAFNALTRGPAGQTGYAGGGFVQPPRVINAGGGQIESFGPMAYQQLMSALRQIITIDGQVVAQSTSRSYAQSTSQGAM